MENKIKSNINDPEKLEKLYQADKKGFESAFHEVYDEIKESNISGFWKIRLEHENQRFDLFNLKKKDILIIILTCAVAGFLIKIPQIFSFSMEDVYFYEKNAGMIVLFGLSLYSLLGKSKIKIAQLIVTLLVFLASAAYINLVPANSQSDSINLAYIHLPLMLWCLYGIIFIDFDLSDKSKRIDYIKYNGDLAILSAIILLAGGILTGITIGLFEAIDLHIAKFYFEYIVICGLVSVPVVATFIVKTYPQVTNKIAPIIANIFSPLVLLTLVIYLVSIAVTGKDPFNDREFLIIFNLLLLGVMGIIVFSVSETSINKKQRLNELTLFILAIITLLVDLIALSAILYRLGEFGFTPNRTAVLGSNLLIFGNLILIMIDLYRVNFRNKEMKQVEMTIAKYLPVYMVWTVFVVFLLPLIFEYS